MLSIRYVLALLVCCYCFQINAQDVIKEIHFVGLKKTKPYYLERFIEIEVGSIFDSILVLEDIQSLRNLRFFDDVSYSTKDTAEGIIVNFHIKEVLTLLPIVNFGGIKGNFWFQLGAVDFNFQGQGNTVGGFYRYYERHSYQVFLKVPNILGSHWGYSLNLAKLSTIEPLYFQDSITYYDYDNLIAELMGRYEFVYGNYLEYAGAYLYEQYKKSIGRNELNTPGPDQAEKNKFLFKTSHTIDQLKYFFHFLSGYSNRLLLEAIMTRGDGDFFLKLSDELKLFLKLKSKGNLALRLRLGSSTNNESPFAPFILDSYVNIRGSGNKVTRGTAELALNTEYRHTLLGKRWGAIQGVIFTDIGSWRPAGGQIEEMFTDENSKLFSGLGLRLYLRPFYNLTLRFDYGINIKDFNETGVVFGLGQYF
ncbi:MAG: hypothetical protein COA57_07250 [Flavobacteriales bacterium]|nr:MAG: hypothetical protein COA57_07250 [Flavobacteriales bacterium]